MLDCLKRDPLIGHLTLNVENILRQCIAHEGTLQETYDLLNSPSGEQITLSFQYEGNAFVGLVFLLLRLLEIQYELAAPCI